MNLSELKNKVKEIAAANGYEGNSTYVQGSCSEYKHNNGKEKIEYTVGIFTTETGGIISASSEYYEIALQMLDIKLKEKQLTDANTTPNNIEL